VRERERKRERERERGRERELVLMKKPDSFGHVVVTTVADKAPCLSTRKEASFLGHCYSCYRAMIPALIGKVVIKVVAFDSKRQVCLLAHPVMLRRAKSRNTLMVDTCDFKYESLYK
jgi:hypothetical protein